MACPSDECHAGFGERGDTNMVWATYCSILELDLKQHQSPISSLVCSLFPHSGDIFFCVKENTSPGLVCTCDYVHSWTGHAPFLSLFCEIVPIICVPEKPQCLLTATHFQFCPTRNQFSTWQHYFETKTAPATALLLTML